jgi:predicted anti-sigma-YlaC factor YlaD
LDGDCKGMTNEATPQLDSGDASAQLGSMRRSVRWMTGGVVVALVAMAMHLFGCQADIHYLRSREGNSNEDMIIYLQWWSAIGGVAFLLTLLPSIVARTVALALCIVLTVLWAPVQLVGSVFALIGASGGPQAGTFQPWQATALLVVNVPSISIAIATVALGFELISRYKQRRRLAT